MLIGQDRVRFFINRWKTGDKFFFILGLQMIVKPESPVFFLNLFYLHSQNAHRMAHLPAICKVTFLPAWYKRTGPEWRIVSCRLCSSQVTLSADSRQLTFNMGKMFFLSYFLIGCCLSSALGSLNLHGEPLFSGLTSFTIAVETLIVEKNSTCYVTSGDVSQCRRKRGIEERPQVLEHYGGFEIQPSAVLG